MKSLLKPFIIVLLPVSSRTVAISSREANDFSDEVRQIFEVGIRRYLI
jgi:hypothetical protein